MSLHQALDIHITEEWEPTDSPPETDILPDAELLANLRHTNGEHRLEVIDDDAAGYLICWYTRAQSMTRETPTRWDLERPHPASSKPVAENTLSLLMATISAMESRADHKVSYAIDGPYDY